jgi:hypothetical protein
MKLLRKEHQLEIHILVNQRINIREDLGKNIEDKENKMFTDTKLLIRNY